MKIIFVKDHPSGISSGTVREVTERFAMRMIAEKFAKKTNADITPAVFKKSLSEKEVEKFEVAEEVSEEVSEEVETTEEVEETEVEKPKGKGKGKK